MGEVRAIAVPLLVVVRLLTDAALDHAPNPVVLPFRVVVTVAPVRASGLRVRRAPRTLVRAALRTLLLFWLLVVVWVTARSAVVLIRLAL